MLTPGGVGGALQFRQHVLIAPVRDSRRFGTSHDEARPDADARGF
jgi:hypothetical protein